MQSTSIPKVTARRTYAKFAIRTSGSSLLILERENPPTITTNKASSTGKPVAHFSRTHVASIPEKVSDGSTGKPVAVTLIAEFQVFLTQPSRKEARIAENHPNRDSLVQDLNKTEEFNPLSEKSKELITSTGITEYFELCETSSKIQCSLLRLKLGSGRYLLHCTCGKCMQPSERNRQLNKARYDVLSIPGYVIKKNPTHGARRGPSVRQTKHHKAHDILRKARKHKSGGRWHDDDKYRKSLSDIGWTEEQIISIR